MTMTLSIAAALANSTALQQSVTIQGWVRTRRDSKAGISFIALYDGSCFQTLQVVVAAALENYESEILKLTAGCAVTVTGTLTRSPGAGQQHEIQAQHIQMIGWIDDPETYPIQPKRHSIGPNEVLSGAKASHLQHRLFTQEVT